MSIIGGRTPTVRAQSRLHSLGVLGALLVAGFIGRVVAGLPFLAPAYPDAVYYLAVARELAAGHGFTIPFIWSFVDVGGHLPAVGALPIASNQHWMPLASIIQVPFIWLLGPRYLASVLPFWILGALAVPMTYLLGLDAGLGRRTALAAAALMIVPAAAAPYLSQPDNYSLYMVLAVSALWLCARGAAGDRRAFAAGGAVVGLAMLARTDGALLGVPYIVAFASEQWAGWRARAAERWLVAPDVRIGWIAAFACFGLFLLVMAPWWIRDAMLFGSISPSSSSGRILWITTYNEQFSLSAVTTPATFFAQGLGPLLASRIGGLVAAVQVLAGTTLGFFLLPFCVIGTWNYRGSPAFRPWLVYATTFFVFSALVFAVHLPYGMALHSGMALVPQAYLLSVVGLTASVRWVAARRPSWRVEQATRNFTLIAIAAAWILGGFATWKLATTWSGEVATETALMRAQQVPVNDRLMSPDPGAYWYRWGIAGVPTPYDPLSVVEATAARYQVRWLILERAYVVPSLEPVLAGTVHPSWLSKPLAVVPASQSDTGPDAALPQAALYAVCLSPGDTRCGP